jgi:hypothetical protein
LQQGIAQKYFGDVCAEPIIARICMVRNMFWQVLANLAAPQALVKVKHLNNILFLSIIAPRKPCLCKADISPLTEHSSATHNVCTTQLPMLGLMHAHHLNSGANQIGIHESPSNLIREIT